MPNCAIVKSRFFMAGTGRKLIREHGRAVACTALYLIACPHSHMAGIYDLPPGTAADELGISADEFLADIAILEGEGFCRYDRAASLVWVVTMMGHQVSAAWKSGDTRVKTIRLHLEALPDSALVSAFRRLYRLSLDGASDGASDGGADGGPLPVPSPSIPENRPGRDPFTADDVFDMATAGLGAAHGRRRGGVL